MTIEQFTEDAGFIEGALVSITKKDGSCITLPFRNVEVWHELDIILIGDHGQSGHLISDLVKVSVVSWPFCLWLHPGLQKRKDVKYIHRTKASVHYTVNDIKKTPHYEIKDDYMQTMVRPFWIDL